MPPCVQGCTLDDAGRTGPLAETTSRPSARGGRPAVEHTVEGALLLGRGRLRSGGGLGVGGFLGVALRVLDELAHAVTSPLADLLVERGAPARLDGLAALLADLLVEGVASFGLHR